MCIILMGLYTFVTWSREMSLLSKKFNFNFYFLPPLSYNFEMLHFDANPITNGYLASELWRICRCSKQYKKGIWTLYLPISQKQHRRHPTHFSWSCNVWPLIFYFHFFPRLAGDKRTWSDKRRSVAWRSCNVLMRRGDNRRNREGQSNRWVGGWLAGVLSFWMDISRSMPYHDKRK